MRLPSGCILSVSPSHNPNTAIEAVSGKNPYRRCGKIGESLPLVHLQFGAANVRSDIKPCYIPMWVMWRMRASLVSQQTGRVVWQCLHYHGIQHPVSHFEIQSTNIGEWMFLTHFENLLSVLMFAQTPDCCNTSIQLPLDGLSRTKVDKG